MFLTLLSSLLVILAQAQAPEDLTDPQPTPAPVTEPQRLDLGDTYFEGLGSRTLGLKLGIQLPLLPLWLQPPSEVSRPDVDYEQNPSPKLGLGIDHRYFSAYLSLVSLPALSPAAVQGSTSYRDFQLHTYMGRWGLDFWYQKFRGYYLSNSQELYPSRYGPEEKLLRPDLVGENFAVNLLFVFNPERLSLEAGLSGTALQKKAGSSAMAVLSVSDQKVHAEQGVLAPPGLENQYGYLGQVQNARLRSVTVGGGGGGNYIFHDPRFFMHASGILGLGPQEQSFSSAALGDRRALKVALKANGRASFGYDDKRWFWAATAVLDDTGANVDEHYLHFVSFQFFLFGGARFDF